MIFIVSWLKPQLDGTKKENQDLDRACVQPQSTAPPLLVQHCWLEGRTHDQFFSAVAKPPVLAPSCEDSLQCCRKARLPVLSQSTQCCRSLKKAFSAGARLPVLSQSTQCCRTTVKKAFSAGARLPVLCKAPSVAVPLGSKPSVLVQGPQCCRKAPSVAVPL